MHALDLTVCKHKQPFTTAHVCGITMISTTSTTRSYHLANKGLSSRQSPLPLWEKLLETRAASRVFDTVHVSSRQRPTTKDSMAVWGQTAAGRQKARPVEDSHAKRIGLSVEYAGPVDLSCILRKPAKLTPIIHDKRGLRWRPSATSHEQARRRRRSDDSLQHEGVTRFKPMPDIHKGLWPSSSDRSSQSSACGGSSSSVFSEASEPGSSDNEIIRKLNPCPESSRRGTPAKSMQRGMTISDSEGSSEAWAMNPERSRRGTPTNDNVRWAVSEMDDSEAPTAAWGVDEHLPVGKIYSSESSRQGTPAKRNRRRGRPVSEVRALMRHKFEMQPQQHSLLDVFRRIGSTRWMDDLNENESNDLHRHDTDRATFTTGLHDYFAPLGISLTELEHNGVFDAIELHSKSSGSIDFNAFAQFMNGNLGDSACRANPAMIVRHNDVKGLARTLNQALGSRTAWVSGLPRWLCNEADLSELMEAVAGPVENIAIRQKHKLSRSWAFVTFVNISGVSKLLKNPPSVTNIKADSEAAAHDHQSWILKIERQNIGVRLKQNVETEIKQGKTPGQLATIAKFAAAPGASIRYREKIKSINAAKAERRRSRQS